MSNSTLITDSPEWEALTRHRAGMEALRIKDLFAGDPQRFRHFHRAMDGVLFDYSKHRVTAETMTLLCDLARARGMETLRDKMTGGEPVNASEGRAVLHMALRGSTAPDLEIDGENVTDFVNETLTRIETVSTTIRNDKDITDVIHIGIGGSDLGPRVVCSALRPMADGPTVHFLSNIDGCALERTLAGLRPEKTAVIIASKTFTTLETLTNARSVEDWFSQRLPPEEWKKRAFAVTANTPAAQAFGIPPGHILPLRDWIGGRFSLWGAVGLPIAIACGFTAFKALLEGARAMDAHFMTAPLENNIPVLMGLLGIWERNFEHRAALAVLPYAQDLEDFPRYLQQLEMESGGKGVDGAGRPVPCATVPVIFGEAGTNAQHAFMQLLHQGPEIIPADLIVVRIPSHDRREHHEHLLSHALAQSKALMDGREDVQNPQKNCSGNRPSSTLILERLDPHHLGMLLALYEHKVFVQGAIWGINSFDQWGVELGKTIAGNIYRVMQNPEEMDTLDGSTAGLLKSLFPES